MNAGLPVRMLCVITLGCCMPMIAAAELTLSITISGTPDELIPLLETLKKMGFGTEGSKQQSDEPIRFEMNSVSSETDAPPETNEEPELGIWGAAAQPSPAKPGDTVMVTLQVTDTEGRIDTIAASMGDDDGLLFDLYDNGTNGDEVARDGVWSYELTVPQSLDVEQYTILIIPYDRNGDEITTEVDGEVQTMRSEVVLAIKR
jgi:hypothetical protein